MIKNITVLLLMIGLLQNVFGQNGFNETQIKSKISSYGTGQRAKVKIEMRDGRKLKGYISSINDDGFAFTDSQTGEQTTIAYKDVAKVKKQGLSTFAKIGIAGAVLGGVLVAVVALGTKDLGEDVFR